VASSHALQSSLALQAVTAELGGPGRGGHGRGVAWRAGARAWPPMLDSVRVISRPPGGSPDEGWGSHGPLSSAGCAAVVFRCVACHDARSSCERCMFTHTRASLDVHDCKCFSASLEPRTFLAGTCSTPKTLLMPARTACESASFAFSSLLGSPSSQTALQCASSSTIWRTAWTSHAGCAMEGVVFVTFAIDPVCFHSRKSASTAEQRASFLRGSQGRS